MNYIRRAVATGAALGVILLAVHETGKGQQPGNANKGPRRKAASTAPAPRLPSGRVDFEGVWDSDKNFRDDISNALKVGESLPLQPWALEVTKKQLAKNDPEANCMPTGVPRMNPYPWRIIENGPRLYFLFEGNIHTFRQVFMDGRPHSKEPNPTWFGESNGHWEGDTLVIDTIGYNDKFWFDFAGHPHTEQLHTIERYQRPDMGHLTWETKVEDPGAYTRPWTVYGKVDLIPNEELMEYICQENNRDVTHLLGRDPRNREAQGK